MDTGTAYLSLVGECAHAVDGYFRNLAAGTGGATAVGQTALLAGPAAISRSAGTGTSRKNSAEAPFSESGKAERLLEAARGLLAGFGPLQRAVDQCTWYAAAGKERRVSPPLAGALREVQRRTLEFVRTLERADAAYVQLFTVDSAAWKTSGGPATSAEAGNGFSSSSPSPGSRPFATCEAEIDHLVQVSAAVTTAYRVLLRELRPQLSTLARHLDARGLRSLLLNVHGAAAEFGAAWTALAAVLLEAPQFQKQKRHGELLATELTAQAAEAQPTSIPLHSTGGQLNGSLPTQHVQPLDQAPPTLDHTARPPGIDVAAASRTFPSSQVPQSGPALAHPAPHPPPTMQAQQQLSKQRSVSLPDSRLCTTAEVATAVAESVISLLDDSIAVLGEDAPDELLGFARQVPVARQAIVRLVNALREYGDPPPPTGPAAAAGSVVDFVRASSGKKLLDEAEAFVKSIIHLSSLAKHVSMVQRNQLSRAAVTGIGTLTRSTKDLALALQDLSSSSTPALSPSGLPNSSYTPSTFPPSAAC